MSENPRGHHRHTPRGAAGVERANRRPRRRGRPWRRRRWRERAPGSRAAPARAGRHRDRGDSPRM